MEGRYQIVNRSGYKAAYRKCMWICTCMYGQPYLCMFTPSHTCVLDYGRSSLCRTFAVIPPSNKTNSRLTLPDGAALLHWLPL